MLLNWIQVRWQNISLRCLKKLFGCFRSMFQVIVHLHCPMSSEAFGWIWADNIAWNTSEFILLLLSAVTSSINTREPVPLAAIHAHTITLPPPCFTDEVVWFGSWAVPSLLHTLLFPSLILWWYIYSYQEKVLNFSCPVHLYAQPYQDVTEEEAVILWRKQRTCLRYRSRDKMEMKKKRELQWPPVLPLVGLSQNRNVCPASRISQSQQNSQMFFLQ